MTVFKELFGGGCSIEIPNNLIDISQLRHVPDHQEVFADQTDRNQSLIVEINELASQARDEDCARFHFEELFEDSFQAGSQKTIDTVLQINSSELPSLPPNAIVYLLHGRILGIPGRDSQPVTNLLVCLTVIRLKNVQTDILIILHQPLENETTLEISSSKNSHLASTTIQEFEQVVKTFKINDWGLFGQ